MDAGLYITKCKSFFKFMVAQNQWSSLTIPDIERWINNFKGLEQDEQYYAYRLLAHIIYFSEKDIIVALTDGLYKTLAYKKVLEEQKKTDFSLSVKALDNIYNEQKNKAIFIPLLDNDSPHESGNYLLRLLVQQGLIDKKQSMFLWTAPEYCENNTVTRMIIVDDCVGSGHQISDFCKATVNINGTEVSIIDYCKNKGIELDYMVLFGYDKTINDLSNELKEMNIYCVRNLTERHRVFEKDSYVWREDEVKSAKKFFECIASNAGIPLLGYNYLDFAFVMNNTIPDWSLPLFWKEKSDWNLLVRRKNSNE